MDAKIVKQLADEWHIDENAVFDAFLQCKNTIARLIPNHPDCSQIHIASLLVADFVCNYRALIVEREGEAGGNQAVLRALKEHTDDILRIVIERD